MVFEPFGSSSVGLGREHHVDSERREQPLVVLGRARIRLELGRVREAERVHEHRHHHDVGDLAGAVDEVDVAVVEGADGGDERDPGPVRRCGSGLGQSGAQPVDGADHPLIVAGGSSSPADPASARAWSIVECASAERYAPGLGTPAWTSSRAACWTIERENSVAVAIPSAYAARSSSAIDDGLAPELDGECLRDRKHRGGRGDRGVGVQELAPIDGRAGEGDGGMDGERDRPHRRGGGEDVDAEGRIGVQHELPRLPRADLGEAGDEPRELVVRHGDHDELAPAHHLQRIEERHARAASPPLGRHPNRA